MLPRIAERVPTAATLERLERHLEPVLGQLMSGAAVKAQRDRLGLAQPTLDRAQLEALVGALAKGTKVFAGTRRTDELFDGLADRMWKELEA